MSESAIVARVRIPLALPLLVQGLRVSLVTNVAAATIGATVGAGGFGVPIVSGIRSFDALLILKGSIPVALLALFADALVRAFEEGAADRAGGNLRSKG
jgi:osmoprotectant transport system permease protein